MLTVCGGAALAVAAALWGLLHLPAATAQAAATAAAVFLAASHGLGVEGVLWGLFAGTLASLLVLAAAVLPGLRLGLAVAEIAPMLRYGLPVMGGLLIRFGLDAALRWMLAALVSLDVLTDYLAAAKVADLFEALFANAFFMAWGTLVYRVIRRPDAGRMTAAALRVTAAAVALLLATAGPMFALVGGGGLHEAPRILPLLLLGKVAVILQSPLSRRRPGPGAVRGDGGDRGVEPPPAAPGGGGGSGGRPRCRRGSAGRGLRRRAGAGHPSPRRPRGDGLGRTGRMGFPAPPALRHAAKRPSQGAGFRVCLRCSLAAAALAPVPF